MWFKKCTQPDTISMSGFTFRPLYFWYDKPHIADVDFYLKTVFSGQQAVLKGRVRVETVIFVTIICNSNL